jgi:hypothetical protein
LPSFSPLDAPQLLRVQPAVNTSSDCNASGPTCIPHFWVSAKKRPQNRQIHAQCSDGLYRCARENTHSRSARKPVFHNGKLSVLMKPGLLQ